MEFELEMKEIVKEKYGSIAKGEHAGHGCGCGSSCGCSTEDVANLMHDEYNGINGYVADADLGLGCGLPTQHAKIKPGKTVLDLGCGAGNDSFIARTLTGDKGRVIGLDFTESMIGKALENNKKLKFDNVEFILGDIEDIPLKNESVDVIISNCVLNLVPDKRRAFKEMARVLSPKGHFCISDTVLDGNIPDKLKGVAELYCGCVSGAVQMDDYLKLIEDSGFTRLEVAEEKEILIPDEILSNYLDDEELKNYRAQGPVVKSVTILGDKRETKPCGCGPGCC